MADPESGAGKSFWKDLAGLIFLEKSAHSPKETRQGTGAANGSRRPRAHVGAMRLGERFAATCRAAASNTRRH
jgi:hypothetical protein